MMPFVVGERIGRVQIVHRRPDLNRVRVDEAILDGVVLTDDADSRAECGRVRNPVRRRDPVFQGKRPAVLEERILCIHPVTLTIERGRAIVGVEADESRRARTWVCLGGTAASNITHEQTVAARAPAVRGHRRSRGFLEPIVGNRPIEQDVRGIGHRIEHELD